MHERGIMSVKHALLGILAQAPRHGYDLKRAFDDKLGDFWNLNVGQIYTTLSRLEADELIQHDAVEQDDKPDKKVYRLTPAGHAEFADWRTRALKPEPRNLRDELFVRILFMEADDTDAVLSVVRTAGRLSQTDDAAHGSQILHRASRAP